MSEANNAFGDPAVYVEKYIDSPKHIEIQVMADSHGRVVTFGERECSMQRRYQKVIEEAPSPVVTAKMRRELSDAARRAAQAVGYCSAGTVEFIADSERNFYFLEMNTRLQVEHPVTELVYGVDLVRMQLEIATGAPLDVPGTTGDVLEPRGHAVEMRIYAEDPSNHFMPHAGKVQRLELPEGPGVRNDNGVYPGAEVPMFYDPMIGKLSVWAETRDDAIARAHRALKEYRCEGVRTNVEFLLWALDEPGFRDGSYDTHYIERYFSADKLHKREHDVEVAATAGVRTHGVRGCARPPGDAMKFVVRVDGQEKTVFITEENGSYEITVDGRNYNVDCRSFGNAEFLSMLIDNESYLVETGPSNPDRGQYYARVMGRHYDLEVLDELLVAVREGEAATDTGVAHIVLSPMPGLIVDVKVAPGDTVEAGAPVVIMEAMKMQNELVADVGGVVKDVHVKPGAAVDSQAPLVTIERE
jgi:acetyl/propionyl-CoA carboxylase alpha subunit